MSVWSEEDLELLKKLWADGLSCSAIAARLSGDRSRNAVIGKVTRLGLPPRAARKSTGRVPGHKPRRAALPKAPVAGRLSMVSGIWSHGTPEGPAPQPVPKGEDPADFPNLLSLDELTTTSCRWPIGDPRQGRFGFCGEKKVEGLPYCADHCRRAYQPPAQQRRRIAETKRDAVKARRHDREEVH